MCRRVYSKNNGDRNNGEIKLLGPLLETFGSKILRNSVLAFIEVYK
jgi:hypothetical protein